MQICSSLIFCRLSFLRLLIHRYHRRGNLAKTSSQTVTRQRSTAREGRQSETARSRFRPSDMKAQYACVGNATNKEGIKDIVDVHLPRSLESSPTNPRGLKLRDKTTTRATVIDRYLLVAPAGLGNVALGALGLENLGALGGVTSGSVSK